MFKRFAITLAFAGTFFGLMSGTAGATNDKVAVCHATGSASNPYVLIVVSEKAWENAHSDHEGDVLATELEVVVDIDKNGREKTDVVRFCPGAEPIPGPQGPAGPAGPSGPQGLPGVPGADGIDGLNGTDGLNGLDGVDGKDGANGLNAVQHNCVSLDGHLYSHSGGCRPLNIVGEAGPQGERGEIGPQGPAGPAGAVVSAASAENTTTTTAPTAEPVGELAHTGSNTWLLGIAVALILGGGFFFFARRIA